MIEALSICDATRGPVARLVKAAILNRDGVAPGWRRSSREIGQVEVPWLEHNLPLLATVAQVAPLLGLMGTLFGFAAVFRELRHPDGVAYGYAAPGQMFDGLMQSLYAAALGIGIAAFCYAAYNYGASRKPHRPRHGTGEPRGGAPDHRGGGGQWWRSSVRRFRGRGK